MIVAILGQSLGLTRTTLECSELAERWSLDEALTYPVDGFGWDALDEAFEGQVEKALYLMPPSHEGEWDPSLAIETAEDLIAWAAEEGHSLVLVGQAVADAFTWPTSEELGKQVAIEAERNHVVRCFGSPDVVEDPRVGDETFEQFLTFLERN